MCFAFLRRATPGTPEKAGGKSLYVRQGTWPSLAFLFINLCEHVVVMEKKKKKTTFASLVKVVPLRPPSSRASQFAHKWLNTRMDFSCFNDKGTGDI